MEIAKTLLLLVLIASVLLTGISSAHASNKDTPISDYVEEFSAKTKCSEVSVAVVQDGDGALRDIACPLEDFRQFLSLWQRIYGIERLSVLVSREPDVPLVVVRGDAG